MRQPLFALFYLCMLVSLTRAVHYSTCIESATRTCSYGTNITDRLLSLKRGGSSLPATNTYDPSFFLCQEYNYNCGYLQQQDDFLTIADGVQLNMTYAQLLLQIPSDPTLTNLIKPYLNTSGSGAKCLNNFFPLVLTDAQSNTAMNGFLARLSSNLSSLYATKKATTSVSWSSLHINIITATLQLAKLNMNGNFATTNYWTYLLANNYAAMGSELRSNYQSTNKLQYLRSSYLVDSAIQSYNKYQSVNFLVDESSAIGSTNFNDVKTFLTNYVTQTTDDPTLISINYFDAAFDTSVSFGSSKSAIISAIASKTCRCSGNGNLGLAINSTIAKINAQGFSNGVNKILVVLVGTTSSDSVYYSSQYARAMGITLVAVAIGGGYSNSQLLQVAYSQSNLIYVSSYVAVTTFHNQLPNLLARQYVDIPLNSKLAGGYVRSVSNPNYYRLPRDSLTNRTYYMAVTFTTDPTLQSLQVLQSHYDPFPDKYSDCNCTMSYRTSIYTYQYYITPTTGLESVALKKDIKVSKFLYYTYITIGGNNLSYTLTLKDCTTTNCSVQIAAAEKIGSLNTNKNSLQQDQGEEDAGSDVIDPSIFVAIGGGIFTLALGTYATINGLRKFRESPHQPEAEDSRMDTNQDLEANNQDNLVRNHQHHHQHNHQHHHQHNHQRHVRGSHKRNGNQRQENRSHRAQRKNHRKQEDKKSSWDDDSECYIEDKKTGQAKNNKDDKHSDKSDNESNKSHKSNKHSHKQKKGTPEKREKKNTPQKEKNKNYNSQKKMKKVTPEKQRKGTVENKRQHK